MTYIEIAGMRYPAEVAGRMRDPDWDNRKSRAITLNMTPAEAAELFVDGIQWNIVHQKDSYEENGVTVTPKETVYDNSEYDVAGQIIDNRDGTVTVKMGVLTEKDTLTELHGVSRMKRAELEALKAKIREQSEKSSDMEVLIGKIRELPFGQLKKVLTDDVLAILNKYGCGEGM